MSVIQSLEREMSLVFPGGGGGGGAILPIMDYTGRFFPKRAPFSVWRYIKGWGFHLLSIEKDKENCHLGIYKGYQNISNRGRPLRNVVHFFCCRYQRGA